MGLLATIRHLVLRDHEREHADVTRQLAEDAHELTAHEVRLRRLEIELRLRERRLGGQ